MSTRFIEQRVKISQNGISKIRVLAIVVSLSQVRYQKGK